MGAAGWRRAAVCTAVSANFLLTYTALFLLNMSSHLSIEKFLRSQFPTGTRNFGLGYTGHHMVAASGLPAVPFPRNVHFPDSTSIFLLRDALATSSIDTNGSNGRLSIDYDVSRVLTPDALGPLPLSVPTVATTDAVTPLPVPPAMSSISVTTILSTSAASCVSARRPNLKITYVLSAMGSKSFNDRQPDDGHLQSVEQQQHRRYSRRSSGRRSSLGSRTSTRHLFLLMGPLLIRYVSISMPFITLTNTRQFYCSTSQSTKLSSPAPSPSLARPCRCPGLTDGKS